MKVAVVILCVGPTYDTKSQKVLYLRTVGIREVYGRENFLLPTYVKKPYCPGQQQFLLTTNTTYPSSRRYQFIHISSVFVSLLQIFVV